MIFVKAGLECKAKKEKCPAFPLSLKLKFNIELD